MTQTQLGAAAAIVFLFTGGPSAHHSIAAVYDATDRVALEGSVAEFRFVNPHPYLIVTGETDGVPVSWHLEMDNRGELAGVGMDASTFRPGDRVRVTGSRSRTEPHSVYVRTLVRPADGFEYEQEGFRPRIRRR